MDLHREDKPHIGFFGRCNTGKSTLVNMLAGQNVSIVSQTKGTTTDTVKKTMELFGAGSVVLIDTAGIDDASPLGEKRVEKTMQAFNLTDVSVVVISQNIAGSYEKDLLQKSKERNIPCILVYNKNDECPVNEQTLRFMQQSKEDFLILSALDKADVKQLSELIAAKLNQRETETENVLQNIVKQGDTVVMVTPIDTSAPKGRLILPQVKMIRQALDCHAMCLTVQPDELQQALNSLNRPPKLVITDSQAFEYVNKIVPRSVYLTSFSLLLAKQKGNFDLYAKGLEQIDRLCDGDTVLMLESCTHQPTCEDIGRVKLPAMLKKYTSKQLNCKAVAGLTDTEKDISKVKLVIQCGGCVASMQQLKNRLQPFVSMNIPVTNYGMAIAYMNGIFKRCSEIFFTNG